VAEIPAGTLHRRVDHGQGFHSRGAQSGLQGTELSHLTPTKRAMQSAEEGDQKRVTVEVGERNRSFLICRRKRKGRRVFSRLQRASLASHGICPLLGFQVKAGIDANPNPITPRHGSLYPDHRANQLKI
jgi:hypothetical protein